MSLKRYIAVPFHEDCGTCFQRGDFSMVKDSEGDYVKCTDEECDADHLSSDDCSYCQYDPEKHKELIQMKLWKKIEELEERLRKLESRDKEETDEEEDDKEEDEDNEKEEDKEEDENNDSDD